MTKTEDTATDAVAPSRLSEYAAQYAEQGYVHVRGLLTRDEAETYRQCTHQLLASLGARDDPTWGSASEVAGGRSTSLQHLHDAQFYDAAYTRLLVDQRFTSVAAAVL